MKTLGTLVLLIVMIAPAALAGPRLSDVLDQLADEGYTRVDMRTVPDTGEVEIRAARGTEERTLTYDRTTRTVYEGASQQSRTRLSAKAPRHDAHDLGEGRPRTGRDCECNSTTLQ